MLCARSSQTMINFNRRGSLQGRRVRNYLGAFLPHHQMGNRLRDNRRNQLVRQVVSMEDSAAKTWNSLGITTLTSLVMHMIPMFLRTLRHLPCHRPNQRVLLYPQLLRQQRWSINLNPRKRGRKRSLHPIQALIHLHQTRTPKRKRRQNQLDSVSQRKLREPSKAALLSLWSRSHNNPPLRL